jgi:hypothetical protein
LAKADNRILGASVGHPTELFVGAANCPILVIGSAAGSLNIAMAAAVMARELANTQAKHRSQAALVPPPKLVSSGAS